MMRHSALSVLAFTPMKSIILSLLAVFGLPAMAAETLAPGSAAPPLVSGEYVQGEPVKAFEKGKVYIVEFWATWCGPCVATIPHVNDLQKKFADKGLIVIGQNVWEREDEKVKPFVTKMGEKMTYRVALDDKSDGGKGKMSDTWMKAAGKSGIPAAFIVDKTGTIVWIGHPVRIDDELIGQIIDGTFDVAANAAKTKEKEEAAGKAEKLFNQFKKSISDKDMVVAAKTIEEIEALNNPQLNAYIPMMRFDIAINTGDGKAAGEHALAIMALTETIKNKQQSAFMLTQIALQLCVAKDLKDSDPKIALQIAEKASALTDGTNPGVLNTLARAKFVAGDKDGAIATQEAAIKNAPKEEMKAKLEKTLAAYKEGKLDPEKE